MRFRDRNLVQSNIGKRTRIVKLDLVYIQGNFLISVQLLICRKNHDYFMIRTEFEFSRRRYAYWPILYFGPLISLKQCLICRQHLLSLRQIAQGEVNTSISAEQKLNSDRQLR